MPRLDDRDALYIGAQEVTAAYLGRTQVWALPSPSTPFILGDTGSGGAGNWPTSADRALMRRIVLPQDTTFNSFSMRMRAGANAGDRFKGLMYAADNTGDYPGTLLIATPQTPIAAGGAELLTISFTDTLITAQEVWIGYVCNGGSGSGSETDSGGSSPNATIMLNGGETSFASPSNPCGLWPGSPGPYSNIPALYFEGFYV